jgi:hypothetical protein
MTDQQILGHVLNSLPEIDEAYWDGNRTPEQELKRAVTTAEEAVIFARAALRRLKNVRSSHPKMKASSVNGAFADETISNLARVCERIYEMKVSAQSEGAILRKQGVDG